MVGYRGGLGDLWMGRKTTVEVVRGQDNRARARRHGRRRNGDSAWTVIRSGGCFRNTTTTGHLCQSRRYLLLYGDICPRPAQFFTHFRCLLASSPLATPCPHHT